MDPGEEQKQRVRKKGRGGRKERLPGTKGGDGGWKDGGGRGRRQREREREADRWIRLTQHKRVNKETGGDSGPAANGDGPRQTASLQCYI